jgi:glycerate-2-kinase
VHNLILGNNAKALAAAEARAVSLGISVLNLGSFIEGETKHVGHTLAGIIRGIQALGIPPGTPLCLLSGGETTVTLCDNPGRGGRNQEFVLAAILRLGQLPNVVVLSGGTDGEDGPTDAAGALADAGTLQRGQRAGLSARECLDHNDAYRFFAATGDLLLTGLTQTNVMDVRVMLVG